MNETKKYCADCKHPESDHHNGKCSGQVVVAEPKLVLCKCKTFVAKPEDAVTVDH